MNDVKDWVKEVGTGLVNCLRYDRLGYWRKPGDAKLSSQTLNYLVSTEDDIKVEKLQTALNAIVEQHNFNGNRIYPFQKDDLVKYM